MTNHAPRVLVSFIGKGIRSTREQGQTYQGYLTRAYEFSEPEHRSAETDLFGTALIEYFRRVLNTPIDLWLLLGSPQSNWGALIAAVPPEQQDDALKSMGETIAAAVREEESPPSSPQGRGVINQSLLDTWSQMLSERMGAPRVKCQLIGWGEHRAAQLQMWQILDEAVPEGAELILDVTHGFRHQPMLLAPMIILLGYLKAINEVTLYYGAMDMSPASNAPAQVLRIDLFPELLEYIRRQGLLQIAGDYEPLGEYLLRDHPTLQQRLKDIAFRERANLRISPSRVEAFLRKIRQQAPTDPLGRVFTAQIERELRKHLAPSLWQRLAQRADEAIEHHDYLVAFTLLYEAITTLQVQRLRPNDPVSLNDHNFRRDAYNQLLSDPALSADEQSLLRSFRAVRNWMVHGTPQTDAGANEAVKSPQGICALYRDTSRLLHTLSQRFATT
ncbi:MAG: CRISPR-associated DxTHG motif protein [Fimbriimonadales bacterium]|nr:CRISPR-associated DxTHG motif protein [Fimbriimonadales bacterium]